MQELQGLRNVAPVGRDDADNASGGDCEAADRADGPHQPMGARPRFVFIGDDALDLRGVDETGCLPLFETSPRHHCRDGARKRGRVHVVNEDLAGARPREAFFASLARTAIGAAHPLTVGYTATGMPSSGSRAPALDPLEYLDALSRAVPQHIVRAVLNEPSERAVRHAAVDGTVLYADLAGFTSLSEKLAEGGSDGLSRLSTILDKLFGALVDQALLPYGGSIAQFGGDSVTTFFDGEGHAGRAAAAALTAQRIMHGEVGRLAVELDTNMALRIGMASGRIELPVLGDLTRRVVVCGGKPVHRALALQAEAAPATVSVDSSTMTLLGNNAEVVERKDDRAVLRHLRVFPPSQPVTGFDLGARGDAARKVQLLEPFVPQPLALRLRTTPSGWRIEGELRHVIVVFSEVTGLKTEHGIESIEHVSRSMLRAYRRHAGVVSKADVTTVGHRIMVLFGLHEPSENDAERALLAAIEATNRVRPLIQPYGEGVHMRTGVHSGRVYFGAIARRQARHHRGRRHRKRGSALPLARGSRRSSGDRCGGEAHWRRAAHELARADDRKRQAPSAAYGGGARAGRGLHAPREATQSRTLSRGPRRRARQAHQRCR